MSLTSKTRILIADDSAFMRKVLVSILSAEPQFEVVGEARDGKEAVSLSESLKPDVITMDINMPHMDGLQATELIMSSQPKPIVIVSSESREGADITLKALELGAIDFVPKPNSGIDLDMSSVRDDLIRKVRIAAKVRVVRNASRAKMHHEIANSAPRTEPAPRNPVQAEEPTPASAMINPRAAAKFPIIVLAASTGGPATLMKFAPAFGKNFQGAVLLVQHMPASFTSQFAVQLAEVCSIRVKEAEHNEVIEAGTFYVCPGSHHLRVSPSGRVTLDDGPRIAGYKPCADVTLDSVAQFAGPLAIGVVMTGMGADASRGVQAVKQMGGHVIAQDEATSVIFGMPSEAIKTGAVDQVLPVDSIHSAIEKRILYVFGAAKVGAL